MGMTDDEKERQQKLRDRYCQEICKARCCYFRSPEEGIVMCPHLTPEKKCNCYKERYAAGQPDLVVVGYWKSRAYRDLKGNKATRPFWCGRIRQLLATGVLPDDVVAGCVYAHPELLEKLTVPTSI